MTDTSKYGPWAVIAGGSEGVGSEFARMLAEDGFNLVLIARKPGPLATTAQTCRDLGGRRAAGGSRSARPDVDFADRRCHR